MWILGPKGLIQFQLREPHKQVSLRHRPKISLQSYPALPTPTTSLFMDSIPCPWGKKALTFSLN